MRKTERKFYTFLSVFLSFCLIFTMTAGGFISSAGAEVQEDDGEEDEGKSTASYDCVWFGQYPQSEVKMGTEMYDKLSALEESAWNSYRETIYQGKRYRRMKAYQAHQYRLKDSGYFQWGTIKEWRYFVYEPIKWRVLSRQDGKALLLADQAVDSGEYGGSSWSSCKLRKWLNTEASINNLGSNQFYFQCYAFSEEEQSAIVERQVPAEDPAKGSETVMDRVTLPDMAELTDSAYGFKDTAEQMDDARSCTMTEFAFAMGAQSNSGCMSGAYWLRYHPGSWENCVGYTGMYMRDHMIADTCYDICIRPMLVLDLSQTACYEDAGTVDFNLPEGQRYREKAYSDPLRGGFPFLYGTGWHAWDCVWWGSYPGQEVTGEKSWELYCRIQAQPESAWKENVLNLSDGRYLRAGPESDRRYFAIQPVRWRVIRRNEQGILLMADECMDIRRYRDPGQAVLWKDSSLQSWLVSRDGMLGTLCSVEEQSLLQPVRDAVISLPDKEDTGTVLVKANGGFSDYAKAVWCWNKSGSNTVERDMQKAGWWLADSTGKTTAGWYACISTEETKPKIYEEPYMDQVAEADTSLRGIVSVISLPLSAEKDLVRAGITMEEGKRSIMETEGSRIPISYPQDTPEPSMPSSEAAVTSSPAVSEAPQETPIQTGNPGGQPSPEQPETSYPGQTPDGGEAVVTQPPGYGSPQPSGTVIPQSSDPPPGYNSPQPTSDPQSPGYDSPQPSDADMPKPSSDPPPPDFATSQPSLEIQTPPAATGSLEPSDFQTFTDNSLEGISLKRGSLGQVIIGWKAYAGAQGYEIFCKKGSGAGKRIAVVSAWKKFYEDFGIREKGIYYYAVRAYCRNGTKWYYSGYGTWEPIQISISVKRPVLRISHRKQKLLFRIRHDNNVCGVSLEMRSGRKRYRQIRLGSQSRWIKTYGSDTAFSMRVGDARGKYSFRVRTYVINRKKKYYSRYSKDAVVRL